MASPTRFFSFRKSLFVLLPLLLLGSYAIHEVSGYSYGIVGASKQGCSCHNYGANTVVKISTAATKIVAGGTYTFHISVSNPSERGGGCDISVDNGAILAVNGTTSGLQYIAPPTNELTHTQPLAFAGDSAVWTFQYTAPTTVGTAHIYAAGNAVNLDGGSGGDAWNLTSYVINVVAAPGPHVSAPALIRDTALRGDTSQINFWVKNSGTLELDISSDALKYGTSYHTLPALPLAIPPGDSSALTVDFIPAIKGTIIDTLHIYSNDSTRPVVSVALAGIGTSGLYHVSASPIKFAPIALTHTDTMSVTISNTGNGLLTVSPYSLTLAHPDFTLISLKPSDASFDLAPKGSLVASFAFTPSIAGNDTAEFPLIVSEYEGNTIDTNITLIGTGVQNAGVDPLEVKKVTFSVFPNPSSGIIELSSIGMTGPADVEISDPAGSIVFRKGIILGNESSIDLSTLPNGTYFIAVESANAQSSVSKIVLQR